MTGQIAIPTEVQAVLDANDVNQVCETLFGFRNGLGNFIETQDPEAREALYIHLEKWILPRATFGQLVEIVGSFWSDKKLVYERMAAIAEPTDAERFVVQMLRDCGCSPGTAERERIMPFIEAVAVRDKDYAVAVMGALLSHLDDIVSGSVVEALKEAMRKASA